MQKSTRQMLNVKGQVFSKSGFSLIEVVIYAVLFVILAIAVINVLVVLAGNFVHTSRVRALSQSAISSLDRLSREIKEADAIVVASSTLGSSPGVLTLQSTHPTTTTRTVQFSKSSDGDLLIKENNNPAYPLTASSIDVNTLIFRQISSGSTTAIKVELELVNADETTTRAWYYLTDVMRGTYP